MPKTSSTLRLPLLIALCLSLIACVAVLAPGADADESQSTGGPAQPLVSFCDFAGTPSSTEAACRKDLLVPGPNAEIVETPNQLPTRAQLAAAAGETPAAPSGPAPAPTFDGPTGPQVHADLDAQASRALFQEANKNLLSGLAVEPIPAQAEVLSASGNSALVDVPGEGVSVVDSSEPLVTGPANRPIELDVEQTGATFEPQRPVVDVSLPESAYEPAELPQTGISVTYDPAVPTGGEDGLAGEPLGSEGVFYSEADTDTDLFIAPITAGFELFAQLRSAESPEELRFDLDLPAGASVQMAPGDIGAAEIVDSSDELIATVGAPLAVDAAGASVAVSMAVEGEDLVLEADHRGSGAAYPITVDPPFAAAFDWTAGAGFGGWFSTKTDPDFQQYQNLWPNTGLWNFAASGVGLSANTLANWYYLVPHYSAGTSAFISSASMTAAYGVQSSAQDRPRVALGLWKPATSTWADVTHYSTTQAMTTVPLTGGSGTKRADFQLYTTADPITTNSNKSANMQKATVWLDDAEAPSGSLSGTANGWVDGSAATYSMTSNSTDAGLGVKSQSVILGQDEIGDNVTEPTVYQGCTGAAGSPCPQSGWNPSFSIDPDELRDGLQVFATGLADATGKGYINAKFWGVDRQIPVLADATATAPDPVTGARSVTISAIDGEPDRASATPETEWPEAQSGITSAELLIDGNVVSPQHVQTQVCEGDGISGNGAPSGEIPWGSCDLQHTFEVSAAQAPPGSSVSIRLTDAAGNETTDSITSQFNGVVEPDTITTIELEEAVPVDDLADSLDAAPTHVDVHQFAYASPESEPIDQSSGYVANPNDTVEEAAGKYENRYDAAVEALVEEANVTAPNGDPLEVSDFSPDPLASQVQLAGDASTANLGALTANVASVTVDHRPTNFSDPLPSSTLSEVEPPLQPNEAAAQLAENNSARWSPQEGRLFTQNRNKEALITATLRWTGEYSINGFNAGEAYEHDLKLINSNNSGSHPFCGDDAAKFWAVRPLKNADVAWVTTLPKRTGPYLDTIVGDSCTQADFTVGLYFPMNLGDRHYAIQFAVKRGTRSKSRYQLYGERKNKSCHSTPWCVSGDVVMPQILVNKDKGLAPECRKWRKGNPSKPC